jgi:hypothetical protein
MLADSALREAPLLFLGPKLLSHCSASAGLLLYIEKGRSFITFLGIGIVGDPSIRVYFVNRVPVGVIIFTTAECSGFTEDVQVYC